MLIVYPVLGIFYIANPLYFLPQYILSSLVFEFLIFLILRKILLYNPGQPQIHDHPGLASKILGL